MTHRQVLELSAQLCQHGRAVAIGCRGISPKALQRYWDTNKNRSDAWRAVLLKAGKCPSAIESQSGVPWRDFLKPIFEEIATSGILVRVASSVFRAIGERLDIPLAIDVADRTATLHCRAAEAAMLCVLPRPDIPAQDVESLKRLGRLCDRLSDLLCGTLKAQLWIDRFVVDERRAADFAETFGPRPELVRIPVRMTFRSLPNSPLAHGELAEEIKRSLIECLPSLERLGSRPCGGTAELRTLLRTPGGPLRQTRAHGPETHGYDSPLLLSFPALWFSKILGKVPEDA